MRRIWLMVTIYLSARVLSEGLIELGRDFEREEWVPRMGTLSTMLEEAELEAEKLRLAAEQRRV